MGPGDRVLPRRPSAGHSPHEWLGAEPGTRGAGGGAPIHAHSSDCPAAWPWDPAGPLRLPWGNNCGWKGEGVSRSDWSSDWRLRRGSPAPGTESTEGPRPEGPGPGEPGRDQQPLTAPIAALADLNWPRESSPQDPPPSHPRAQRRAHSHTHTYLHSRSCSPAHTTTHISTHAHGHKLALTHVLTCTLTDTHLHTQTYTFTYTGHTRTHPYASTHTHVHPHPAVTLSYTAYTSSLIDTHASYGHSHHHTLVHTPTWTHIHTPSTDIHSRAHTQTHSTRTYTQLSLYPQTQRYTRTHCDTLEPSRIHLHTHLLALNCSRTH